MKKYLSVLLLLAGFLTAFSFSASHLAAQQQPQRERRVSAAPSPTPSPTPVAQPLPGGLAPVNSSVETLRKAISSLLMSRGLDDAMVAIKVQSLSTGQVLFEQNAQKLMRPASNMKLYTVAAALDRLGPDYRFKTSVYAANRPNTDGIVNGDLVIYGRGDPTFSFRFNNGDYYKRINDLADRIVAAGVKRVNGDLIGDESFFTGAPYGSGWEWEDLQWWYGAEVSALSVNDNFVNLSIKPGALGSPAVVTVLPGDPLLTIKNRMVTGARGTRRDLSVYRELGSNVVEVSGSIPVNDAGYSGRLAISQPALLFTYLLRSALSSRGVVVAGKSRVVDNRSGESLIPRNGPPAHLVELASVDSVPLSVIAAQTLKPSQNLYTELILRTLGRVTPPILNLPRTTGIDDSGEQTDSPSLARTSESDGIEVVKSFLTQAGLDPSILNLTDASGLSRNDLITANANIDLLTYMRRHRYAQAFRDALPIAGVDGTLRNRMKGTAAQNNLRAKTGTLSSAASLSGYVTTVSGEELAFSIIVNNYVDSRFNPLSVIDPIAVLLASFNGHS